MSASDSKSPVKTPPAGTTPPAAPGGTPPGPESGPKNFTVIFKEKELTIARYENEDGSHGFMVTNGTNIMHFDSNGNLILGAGKSGNSGCGGKLVIAAEEAIQKYNTYAIEIKGNDGDATSSEGSKGDTEIKKVPPFSIAVYGDVAIEAIGGDIGLKGKNVSIKANNNLSLQATENITIQTGSKGSGNINFYTSNFNLSANYFRRNVSGAEYVEGTGEVAIEQNKPGASQAFSTPGGINYTVGGNYEFGVKGDLNIVSEGAIGLSAKKNLFMTVGNGNFNLKASGKGAVTFDGTPSVPAIKQKETFLLKTGTPGKPSIKVDAGGDVEVTATPGDFKVTSTKNIVLSGATLVEIKSAKILLN